MSDVTTNEVATQEKTSVDNSNQTKQESAKPTKAKNIRKTIATLQAGSIRSRDERYQKMAKQRRERAINKAKAFEDKVLNQPTEIEAKDSILLDRNIKNSIKLWNFTATIDDNYIKDAVFGSWQHLDECFNTILYEVPAYIADKRKVAEINMAVEGRFKDLEAVYNKHNEALQELLKRYDINIKELVDNPESPVQRASMPLKVNFKYSSSKTRKFLALCAKFDALITIETYMEQFDYIREESRIKDARSFQHAIRQYARSIFAIQAEFHKLVRKNSRARNEANKEAQAKQNQDTQNKSATSTNEEKPKAPAKDAKPAEKAKPEAEVKTETSKKTENK